MRHTRRVAAWSAVFVVAASAMACGDDRPVGGDTAVGTSVTGYLYVEGEQPVHLCERLAESLPPQCPGPSTVVVGLDFAQVAGVEASGDVQWTDRRITLLGHLAGGTLTVPVTATGPAIAGRATAGPVCPVEKNPPDPACAPRSVEGATVILRSGKTEITMVTDATGRYAVKVPAGTYTVEATPVTGFMGTPAPLEVTVTTEPVAVDLGYDTGIR